ncbi:hypothetical protein LCGC14_0737160 [marine sediment metagenome]|uniref:Uncharacterized protein n=1 Tax=marine sediment metagenome TaxID=412755 RepID=A0A0F9TEY8_9ZZZZ
MTVPKAGYLAAAYYGAVKISGIGSWTYGGETRNMGDIDEFLDEEVKGIPLQIVGGDIIVTGHYKLDSDAGQQLLDTAFKAGTAITTLKLYSDYVNGIYMQVVAGGYVTVTNVNNLGVDKAGVGTYSVTLHVSGQMEQIGDSVGVVAAAIGVHTLIATSANFIGELVDLGGESPVTCLFQYGTTTAYGTDTAAGDVLTAVGMFEAITGLLITATEYHWRVKCTFAGAPTVFLGQDQVFTTP